VFSNPAAPTQSFDSRHRFRGRQTVAFRVAACISSPLTNIAVRLSVLDDESRLAAAVAPLGSSALVLRRHCSLVGVRSVSMVIDGRSRVGTLPPQISEIGRPRPYGDSFAAPSDAL
jgi:hypothetical protein